MKRVARESSTLFLYTTANRMLSPQARLPWRPHTKDSNFL
jgi:hypothetical protein